MKYLTANIVALAAISGAVFLAYFEKSGWGWMVLIAILSTGVSLEFKE